MPVSTSPVKILLDLEIDLDNLSSEENYLSALIEATNMLSISNSGDGRIKILQEEIKRVRGERVPAIKERRTRISTASLLGRSTNKEPRKLLSASKKMVDRKRMMSSSLEIVVSSIAERLTSIESTLLEKQKLEKKNAESNRKVAENLNRQKKENRLEQGQQTGFLTGAAKKILEPVQGVLGRIFKFITTLILAKAFINVLKWFGNPANKKKVDSLVTFFSANWGKLLSAYLVFGTGLGRFVQFLTKTVISGTIKLTALTAKLLAAKGVKGARGFARAFSGGRGNKLARGLQVIGTAGAVLGMGGMFQGMEEGGEVSGEKGVDKIPTMLTDGEFVMSKGAVQKFGVDTLQSMNAMGGGSGIPKMMDGVTYANEGGQIKKNYSYKLSGASKDLIGGDKKFLKAIEGLSARRDINPAQLLGLIASESGFNAQASNPSGATGLIQFMPMVAERMGITTEDIGKMNRSDQVGLIDQYFSMNQLPNSPTAGQLYTNVFMPALTNKGSDYEITREDDKYNNAYIYRENAGLDKNKDGIITIDEMGGRIFDKMEEFGIKDTTKTKKNKGFNLLNPFSWFSGQAQGAIDQAEKGKGVFGDSLTGRMLEKKRALAEAQGYNKGGLVGKGGNGMRDLAPAADGSILRVSSNVKDFNKDHFGTTGYRLGQVNPRTLFSGRSKFTENTTLTSSTKEDKLSGLKNFLFNRDYDKFTFDDSEIGLTKYTENVRKTIGGETFTSSKTYRSESASIGVPDLIEHQDQLLKQIHRIKGFENISIGDVINGRTGMSQDQLLPILRKSDAQKATLEKQAAASEIDRKAMGIKRGEGYSYFQTNFNKGGLVPDIKGYNEGGFVDALGKGANIAMIAMDVAALAGLLFPEPTTSALGAARLAMRFGGRGLGLARGARIGATGLKSGGFNALRGAKNLHTGSGGLLSPFGRGVYSAPNVGRVGSSGLRPGTGAARYTKFGSNPLKSGSDIGGGVVGSIVPGGARRIGGIEPQSVVNPKMFQKGQKLFQKLQQGAYGKSATANRLRSQASMSGFKAGQSNIPIQNIPKFAEGGSIGSMNPTSNLIDIKPPMGGGIQVIVNEPTREVINQTGSSPTYGKRERPVAGFSRSFDKIETLGIA